MISVILGVAALFFGWHGIGSGFENICPFEIEHFFGPKNHLRTPMAHCTFAYSVIGLVSLAGFVYTGWKGDLLSRIKAIVMWIEAPALWVFVLGFGYLGTFPLLVLLGQMGMSGVPYGVSREAWCVLLMTLFYGAAVMCAFMFKNIRVTLCAAVVICACFAVMDAHALLNIQHMDFTPSETYSEDFNDDVDFYFRFESKANVWEPTLHISLWAGLLLTLVGTGAFLFGAWKIKR